MKVFLINNYDNDIIKYFEKSFLKFVENFNDADEFNYEQYIYNDKFFKIKTLFIDKKGFVYCIDISKISQIYWGLFLIGRIDDEKIIGRVEYFFNNLSGILLHNLLIISKKISLNKDFLNSLINVSIKDFLNNNFNLETKIILKNDVLSPSNLVLSESIYKLYKLISDKLETLDLSSIYFEDFILSLLPFKYWSNSLFFLNSKLKFKISDFFNEYDDIISLHIPVARSKYLEDLFESLLLQTNKNFKIFIGVDGYNEKQKYDIVKIIKKYKDKFDNFDFFVNRKNLGVGKTRRKLMNGDKKSKYIVFLDDDNFLSSNVIDFLYENIKFYPNMGMYSISNIDIRFDADFRNYIHNNGPFSQPDVYTNRERVNRLPLYCNQEETPLIHNRFYSDLLNIKYNKVFDNCSIDMVFNRFLEIICGNINLKGAYQFMRVGHQYHQTRENGFEIKEFLYVMYILKTISNLNNNNYYYTYVIKTEIPKQNELFTN